MSDTRAVTVRAPRPTEIVLTRVFDAPRWLVFEALTRPELLGRWFGADGWDLVDCEVDLRVGGRWRFVSVGPGGAEMGHGGVYREVVPPQRLVVHRDLRRPVVPRRVAGDRRAQRARRAHNDLTTTLWFPSRQVRDQVLSSPMERGVGESYDRLARLLRAVADRDTTRRQVMNWTLEVVIGPGRRTSTGPRPSTPTNSASPSTTTPRSATSCASSSSPRPDRAARS